MADEARVQVSVQVNDTNTNKSYQSDNTAYNEDITTPTGPSPGTVSATTAGVSVTFTGLSTPGLCVLKNMDGTNYVEYGIWDGVTFHELGELPPDNKPQVIKLSRNMTGFRLKANTATCLVLVEAFEA